MNTVLLVAILTLPNTNHTAYEIVGSFANYKDCTIEKRRQEQTVQTIKTGYVCLPADRN
jgi:hypothetical protein